MVDNNFLETLNKEQRRAVEHIDGPLLVVAGPGTGKTQLLSSRVANILQATDTTASSILCLTFTNKAAINMRERIVKITDGKARDVSVKTFHSFASEVMNMYPDYFWNGARLSTAPDAVQLEIIQTVLSELPLDNPLALRFAGKFTVTGDVMRSLKLAKEAGLTPDKLRLLIQSNRVYIDTIEAEFSEILSERLSLKNLDQLLDKVQSLPQQSTDESTAPLISLSTTISESLRNAIELDKSLGKTTNTGAWKRRWIQTVDGERGMFTERSRNDWWLALAGVYTSYRSVLHERGYYDYSDMLVEVITQLEKHPQVRADLQERFLYVMIDEFQDTNAAQMRLAHLVADHHTAEGKPNLMAVGDDDQSIFKFNGAELSNMLSFRRTYPSCQTIVLTDNYRSTQDILNVSEKVIEQAEDRLVHRDITIKKRLIAQANVPSGTIDHIIYNSREEQLSATARIIAKNYTADESVAMIARGHESLRNFASLLLTLGVPVHYEQQRNILEHSLVQQVCLLAQTVEAISNGDLEYVNASLARSLQHPMWQIAPKTLWQLALHNRREPDWLESLSEHKDPKLQKIAALLFDLSQACAGEPLPVCIELLLGLRPVGDNISPVREHFIPAERRSSDYLHGISAIQALRNLASEYSAKQSADLEDFVSFIRLEIENGAVINDESPFVSGEHAVSLLSVHKAKGLEFDSVYVIDAVENNWQPRKGGRKPPANLPLQPVGDDMDDYARLMFVAVTRAKSSLHITSYNKDAYGNEVIVSPLVSRAIEPTQPKTRVEPVVVLEEAIAWPRLVATDERELLKARLSTYSLSVTHLLNFLDVTKGGPQHFLESNILRLPAAKTTSLAHGTATHAALETAQKLVNADEYSIGKVQAAYKAALLREHLPASETARYLKHGEQLLKKLLDGGLLQLQKGSAPEQNITDVLIGNARLSGKLDRVDKTGDGFLVSDYKTGPPLTNFATKDATQAIKAWKQRTQLIYYALLLQNSPRFNLAGKSVTGQMIYLDASNAKDMYRTYAPTAEEVQRLAALTQAIWGKIMAMDLPDISKYPQDISGVLQFEEDLLNS